MAAASLEEPNEMTSKDSLPVVTGLLQELNLDFCAQDYSKYVKVDVSSEVNRFETIIEDMLVRLDELCQTADMVRSESGMFLSDFLPRINAQSEDLPAIFEKIDQLEAFVPVVRKYVDQLEEKVNTAEKELGASKVNTVKGLLSSLPIKKFRQKKDTKPTKAEWTPISLLDTKQYFSKDEQRQDIDVSHEEIATTDKPS